MPATAASTSPVPPGTFIPMRASTSPVRPGTWELTAILASISPAQPETGAVFIAKRVSG